MTSKILALLLLSANLASADDRPPAETPDAIDAVRATEHDASARERYHAQLTTIAERDIVTAQITRDSALHQWDAAVRDRRAGEAGRWAKRYAEALREEQDAQARATQHARLRDQARADFDIAAAKVRKLERRAAR